MFEVKSELKQAYDALHENEPSMDEKRKVLKSVMEKHRRERDEIERIRKEQGDDAANLFAEECRKHDGVLLSHDELIQKIRDEQGEDGVKRYEYEMETYRQFASEHGYSMI